MLLALSVISAQGASMGAAAFKVFDARGGSIGRIESNDWSLPDPERFVSGRHAVVRFESGDFCLEDVSTNGTFLNGPEQAVAKSEAVRLKDGDRLFIGDYEILVQLIEEGLAGAAPSAEAVAPELLASLGLETAGVDGALAGQLGAIVRAVVQGTIEALRARGEAKSNLRMPTTSMQPAENNPLKFSLNADDALHNLFIKRHPGYLGPLEAFQEAFQDLACHQRAVLTAIREAYRSMFERFSPEHLEEVFASRQRRTSMIPMGARSRLWEMYCAEFEELEKDGEASFQNLFGEEFARAYHDALQRLTQASKSRNK